MRKFFGDIPDKDKKLAAQLDEQEVWFDKYGKEIDERVAAQGLICLAHDWISMGANEEAHRLLLKAEKLCPHYYEKYLLPDMLKNPDFNLLVQNLSSFLAQDLIDLIRDRDGF
jgi:hypothetical protein